MSNGISINLKKLSKINLKAIPDALIAVGKYGKQHAPTIMTIIGVGGFWAAGFSALKHVPEAKKEIEQEAAARTENGLEALDRVDKARIYAKHCWRPAGLAVGSTVLILKAHSKDLAKLGAMTGMYQSAKNELMAIHDRVNEKASDDLKKGDLKKARRDLEAKDFEKNPVTKNSQVYETHNGNTMFIETYSGMRFHSSITAVNTAITWLNTELLNTGYVQLSELYDHLDIPGTSPKCGKYAAFRAARSGDLIYPESILDWHDYVDPTTGEPRICYINFERFLGPSDDFAENRPW